MDFSELGPLTVACRQCGKPIEHEHQSTSVMVRVWVERIGQYRDEGPFHADCGKVRDKQAQSDSDQAKWFAPFCNCAACMARDA